MINFDGDEEVRVNGPLFVHVIFECHYLYSQGYEEEGGHATIWKAENGRQTTKKGAMEV